MLFQIIRIYSDHSVYTVLCGNMISALHAIMIYLEDPDCIIVKIFDVEAEKFVVDYAR